MKKIISVLVALCFMSTLCFAEGIDYRRNNNMEDLNTDVIPSIDGTYDLGSATNAWSNIYVDTINSTGVNEKIEGTTYGQYIDFNDIGDETITIDDAGTNPLAIGIETQGNDSIQLGIKVNNATYSGYLSLVEQADMGNANRSPNAISADPRFRVYSADEATWNDYVEIYHNQAEGVLYSGNALAIDGSLGQTKFRDNGTDVIKIFADYNYRQALIGLQAVAAGNQLILAGYGDVGSSYDFDHAAQTDPTLFIHSDTNPDTDNSQYTAIWSDVTGTNIMVGHENGTYPGSISFNDVTGTMVEMARGKTDTDITYFTMINADGEVCYCYPNADQNGFTVSSTQP